MGPKWRLGGVVVPLDADDNSDDNRDDSCCPPGLAAKGAAVGGVNKVVDGDQRFS